MRFPLTVLGNGLGSVTAITILARSKYSVWVSNARLIHIKEGTIRLTQMVLVARTASKSCAANQWARADFTVLAWLCHSSARSVG
jgi:hypothetical protein